MTRAANALGSLEKEIRMVLTATLLRSQREEMYCVDNAGTLQAWVDNPIIDGIDWPDLFPPRHAHVFYFGAADPAVETAVFPRTSAATVSFAAKDVVMTEYDFDAMVVRGKDLKEKYGLSSIDLVITPTKFTLQFWTRDNVAKPKAAKAWDMWLTITYNLLGPTQTITREGSSVAASPKVTLGEAGFTPDDATMHNQLHIA